jgi:non-canonical purine NTP pyrophosphatase (RdgB/HAM1 family)
VSHPAKHRRLPTPGPFRGGPKLSGRRLAIATANPGKLREFQALLCDPGLELIACPVDVEESSTTYAGNARLKAEAAARESGLVALGDDSGLEVAALGGFPGLRSARIASSQEERNAIVLGRLRGQPRPWGARFVCVLVLVSEGHRISTYGGAVDGEVVEPRDRGYGFGYDPLFLVGEVGLTFGEMDDRLKQRLSHRARAVAALRESGDLTRI